jgi:tetratricopeptide (TPR) repeat protein
MILDEEFLKEIVSLFRESRLNVFCGAGISSAPPSNLPLANELKLNIVTRLVGHERSQMLANQLDKIPLELVIEIIDENSSRFIPALARLFHGTQPNRNHLFLARLMAMAHLQTVMTTNFDTMLEKAIGGQSTLNFMVYSTEDAFSSIKLNDLSLPSIIKIHGTADDVASIRSTVQEIAMPGKSEARKNAISLFFQETQKSILVLGYGAGDEFDINPSLRSLTSLSREAKIYFVKHQARDIFEMRPLADPFSNFNGASILCNTDRLITELKAELLSERDSAEATGAEKWQQFLDEWDAEISNPNRLVLAAEVFGQIGELQSARQCYLESLEKWSDDLNRMKTLINLGDVEERMGLFQEAEPHFKAPFEIAEKLGNENAKAVIFQHLGQLAYQREDYSAAMVLTRQGEAIFERQSQESTKGVSAVNHQLGMILSAMGFGSKAEQRLQKSIQMSIELGDLNGQATSLAQLGLTYTLQKKFDDALGAFAQARSILAKLGKTDIISRIDHDIAETERRARST